MELKLFKMMAEVNITELTCDTKAEIQPGETQVGVMSDDLKRLYGLRDSSRTAANTVGTQIQEKDEEHRRQHRQKSAGRACCADHSEEMEKLLEEFSIAKAKHMALDEVFWNAARIEFPELLGKARIGIRKDFAMVWEKTDDSTPSEMEGLEAALLASVLSSLGDKGILHGRRFPF